LEATEVDDLKSCPEIIDDSWVLGRFLQNLMILMAKCLVLF
jgi:hypothetical protein